MHIDDLENSNKSLKSQLINLTFSIDQFSSSDKDVAYYTGFQSFNMFQKLWQYLEEKANHLIHWQGKETIISSTSPSYSWERKLQPIDELFLCLVRLRLGLQILDLAFRFSISDASVSRIFTTWINFLCLEFKAIDVPPSRMQIERDMF